ncbi:glycoside hydrolase family 108 protein [Rhodoplanes roseus]|uniref:TtsA-like Glycoside hydrolase family 108 domain-containing protein n=1 Tax=Rhodoplanes roseus TaxID=29409 RepID=A0A327L4K7_9BRAD|nr:glycosyl hydrolase 108 family protein [Rhodoplanes roseus]RAI42618.1 hypothetical protein CH341_18630 [Rhodoplanes roseus]
MAKATYEEALRRLLVHEGGYCDHPSDPGGPTKYGITIFDYRKYIDARGTAADVRAMTVDQAKAIYRARYWDAQRCDALPAGVDYAVFDYGVNSGVGRSGRVLRRLLGLPADGHAVTDAVIAAAAARDPARLVQAICDERLRFLKSLRTWPVFGAGWGRRVAEVRRVALRMVTGRPAGADTRRAGRAIAAGGAAVGGAGGLAHQHGVTIEAIVAVLVLAAMSAGAIWLVRRWRAGRTPTGKAMEPDLQPAQGGRHGLA